MSTTRSRQPLAPRQVNGLRGLDFAQSVEWASLVGRPQWTNMLDMMQVGPVILPPEVYNLDVGCANSFTPIYHDTYNCGQYGKSWKNIYTTRAVTDDMAARHVEIVLGGSTWWRAEPCHGGACKATRSYRTANEALAMLAMP